MSGSTETELGEDAIFVRKHARALATLPEPPETFMKRDLSPGVQDLFEKLASGEFLEQVERNDSPETPRDAYRWRVREHVYKAIQHYHEPLPKGVNLTPCCFHTGFSNLRDGDFECQLCKQEFSEFVTVEEDADEQ